MNRKIRSFLDGMACAFDLTASIRRKKFAERQMRSDAEALAADWYAVGGNFCVSFETIGNEIRSGKTQEETTAKS